MKIKIIIIMICGIIALCLLSSQYGAWEESLSTNVSIQVRDRKKNVQTLMQVPLPPSGSGTQQPITDANSGVAESGTEVLPQESAVPQEDVIPVPEAGGEETEAISQPGGDGGIGIGEESIPVEESGLPEPINEETQEGGAGADEAAVSDNSGQQTDSTGSSGETTAAESEKRQEELEVPSESAGAQEQYNEGQQESQAAISEESEPTGDDNQNALVGTEGEAEVVNSGIQ